MLDYRMLTFVRLCETMNYRRTAELLNMTQPAVTQHIKHLERTYGCRLFTYDERRLQKTDQGELLERYARSALYSQQQLRAKLAFHTPIPLRIGATKTIGAFVLPPMAARYIAGGGMLSVTVDNTDHLLRMLGDGALDFALIEGFFDKHRWGHMLLRQEPFVGLCAQSHPFAGRQIALEEAMTQPLLVREEGSGTRAILEQLLLAHGYHLDHFSRIHSVNDTALLKSLTASGAGITFAYRALMTQDDGLSAFSLQGENVLRAFHYVFLPDTEASERIRAFEGHSPSV